MSTITQRRRVSPPAILALCLASLAASATALFAQDPPAPVVVFGDSYSDPGNGFTFVKTSSTPPDYGLTRSSFPTRRTRRAVTICRTVTRGSNSWPASSGRSAACSPRSLRRIRMR